MSAGTAYAKRYGGGFLDLPTKTTPIDQQFLNAVEVALLQLIGSAPTADGQVAQWDNANTRFGPALILNKNVDAAAAIAKSKLDFTGANGIVNADVAGAAAIARSKLNFGSGLVDADIAVAAAITASKIGSYEIAASKQTITAPVNIVSTNHAAPTAIITPAGAATYDGSACYLEAFFPYIQGVAAVTTTLVLYDGATELDVIGLNATSGGVLVSTNVYIKIPITPSAGTHTYKIGGYLSGAGTAVAGAGAGGANTTTPAWMRVIRA